MISYKYFWGKTERKWKESREINIYLYILLKTKISYLQGRVGKFLLQGFIQNTHM